MIAPNEREALESGELAEWLRNTGGNAAQHLTVRDTFAIGALAGLSSIMPDAAFSDRIGKIAFAIADEMMKARLLE